MKKILIISFSPLHRDPRVYRQIKLLSAKFDITAAGYTQPTLKNVKWWAISNITYTRCDLLFQVMRLKLKIFNKFYYRLNNIRNLKAIWQQSGHPHFDLVIANDIESLPIALDIADDSPVFFDAHEYSPEEYSNFRWKFFYSEYYDWLCKTYLKKAAHMSTVCHGIAERYQEVYDAKPIIIYNAPFYNNLKPRPLQKDTIRLVHHGGVAPERGLEELIYMMRTLDNRFTLDFYLMTNYTGKDPYLEQLKEIAAPFKERITFNLPVPMQELPQTMNQYDIGVYLIQPLNYNNKMCLPNKFFEFIQGRLAIATGPSLEMKKLTELWEIGVVSQDFKGESLAQLLNQLSQDDVWQMKKNANRAAKALCFEESSKPFLQVIEQLMEFQCVV